MKKLFTCLYPNRVTCLSWGLAFLVLILDQVTKYIVHSRFALGESYPLIENWLSLTYVRNEGAAWGMFAGHQNLLSAFAIICLILFIFFRKKLFGQHPKLPFILALLSAGIVGNLIDRLHLNYVIDFIDAHYYAHHFPCFNVADSAICISIFFLFVLQIMYPEKPDDTHC